MKAHSSRPSIALRRTGVRIPSGPLINPHMWRFFIFFDPTGGNIIPVEQVDDANRVQPLQLNRRNLINSFENLTTVVIQPSQIQQISLTL